MRRVVVCIRRPALAKPEQVQPDRLDLIERKVHSLEQSVSKLMQAVSDLKSILDKQGVRQ